MSSSRKTTLVYYERKVRDDKEIQSMLFEGSDDDDLNDEEEPSNDQWVVQKLSKSPLVKAVVSLRRVAEDLGTSSDATKGKGKVSPLKIKRKLSYAVNKVDTPSKRPDIVSPILIKRIPECDIPTNASSSSGYNKLHTIDLLTSDEEDEKQTRRDRKNKNVSKSEVKKRMSSRGPKTPVSKKAVKHDDSNSSEFELTPHSKLRKQHRKAEVVSDDGDEDCLVKKEVLTPSTNFQRTKRRGKSKAKPDSDDDEEFEIQTPSKIIQKRLSDQMKTDIEETKMDNTPSKRRKQIMIPRTDPDETMTVPVSSAICQNNTDRKGTAPIMTLPCSSRIRQSVQNKENLASRTPEKTFENKLSRVFAALDKLSVSTHLGPPSSARKHSEVDSTKQNKRTPKKIPSNNEALKSAVALSRADMTPVKGVTPGNEAEVSSSMTPSKGATPSKSPAKPSERNGHSEEEDEPVRQTRKSRARKAVTSSEDEDEPALPSRTLRARKANVSPIKSPKESPVRSLRQRDQLKKTERYTDFVPGTRNNVNSTPRRSTRISMSPSTPSLRQKVLMANTPRSSLPPLLDESESDEFITPRKTPKSAKKKLDMTPTTPSSSRKVGHGFLSPVVADREGRAPSMPSSALGIARAQLQVSTLPTSLPCREKEFNDIKSFISRKLQDGTGGCMYISGVPGTGKTATVHTVVRTLQKMAEDHEITQFDFVEVNGLRLTEPRQAYVRMWQILSKNKVTPDQALKHLETKFLGRPKRCTVLLVDELDYLCNRRQDVIYNILDWTTKRYSKFVVLAIANTMDLPERTLKGKVTSRMGLTRLVFQPYMYQQLEEIVLNRLDGCKAFHADAVQLVARKVAAVSGDARRALDICRRSTEILELEGRSSVSVLDIQKVLSQIFAGSRVQAIKHCSLMAKLVLRAIRDEVLRTGVEETTVAFIHPQLVSVCALEGKREPTVTDILTICTNLSDSGLIFAEKGRKDINRKISLNISTDDIHYAIDC